MPFVDNMTPLFVYGNLSIEKTWVTFVLILMNLGVGAKFKFENGYQSSGGGHNMEILKSNDPKHS